MAAPVVSGVAALVRSHFPRLTAAQVKEVIISSTKKDQRQVLKPGTEDKMVPFSSLSVAGGIIDVQAILTMAEKVKGKKKVRA